MTPKLAARRGRNGTVECNRPSCSRTLPGAWRVAGDGWATEKDVIFLFLGFGWQWDDVDVWRVTKRAQANADFMAGRRGDARRHETRPHDPLAVDDGALGFYPFNMPIVAICPYCDTPQRLEPDVLGVGRNEHEHRMTTVAGLPGAADTVQQCCSDGRGRGEAVPRCSRNRVRE